MRENKSLKWLNPSLSNYIKDLVEEFNLIPAQRKEELKQLSSFIDARLKKNEIVNLVFICTHNSRRSCMSQIWAQSAAYYFEIPDINCFSGGTEATAFNAKAVNVIKKAGFEVTLIKAGDNPYYEIEFPGSGTIPVWSKVFNDKENPQADFVAVMTCSQADTNCPVVTGALKRITITYEDPQSSDGTANEEQTYEASSKQIAREMFYAFSLVNKESF